MRAALNSLAKPDTWIGWLLEEATAERCELGGGGTGEVVTAPSFPKAFILCLITCPAIYHSLHTLTFVLLVSLSPVVLSELLIYPALIWFSPLRVY